MGVTGRALGVKSRSVGFLCASEATKWPSWRSKTKPQRGQTSASPTVVKAQKAVLPKDIPLIVVGGVTPESIPDWTAAGADGFGLGGGLYKPGQDTHTTLEKARAYVAAVKQA